MRDEDCLEELEEINEIDDDFEKMGVSYIFLHISQSMLMNSDIHRTSTSGGTAFRGRPRGHIGRNAPLHSGGRRVPRALCLV